LLQYSIFLATTKCFGQKKTLNYSARITIAFYSVICRMLKYLWV